MPNEREKGGFDRDEEFRAIIRDIRASQRMSAGDFLWYVIKVTMLISAVLFVLSIITFGHAQGGAKPCAPYDKWVALNQKDLAAIREQGVAVMDTVLSKEKAQAIVKAAEALQPGGGPEAEQVAEGYMAVFPDGMAMVLLGKEGNCVMGTLTIQKEGWDMILKELERGAI